MKPRVIELEKYVNWDEFRESNSNRIRLADFKEANLGGFEWSDGDQIHLCSDGLQKVMPIPKEAVKLYITLTDQKPPILKNVLLIGVDIEINNSDIYLRIPGGNSLDNETEEVFQEIMAEEIAYNSTWFAIFEWE